VTLVGSNPPPEVLKLASNRVRVPGFVSDAGPIFERARLFVAPLRFGAGLKGKIGHAFAYGLPTVTTTIGAEGFDLCNGSDALIADDAAGFAAAIVRAYDDVALWKQLSTNASRIVKRFSPEATRKRLADVAALGRRRRDEIVGVA
jgi:glycosyltransferase involved in cell wall biosynthesis